MNDQTVQSQPSQDSKYQYPDQIHPEDFPEGLIPSVSPQLPGAVRFIGPNQQNVMFNGLEATFRGGSFCSDHPAVIAKMRALQKRGTGIFELIDEIATAVEGVATLFAPRIIPEVEAVKQIAQQVTATAQAVAPAIAAAEVASQAVKGIVSSVEN